MSDEKKNHPTSLGDVDLDVLEGTLSFYIRSINLAVSRRLDERLDGLEIAKGTGKITTLLLVDSHPGIRPSVIAGLILRDRSAMGRLVEQMEEQGLLRRRASSKDGRAQELFITPKGSALAAQVRKLATEQSREFFTVEAGLSEEEQAQLIDVLRRAYRRIVGLP